MVTDERPVAYTGSHFTVEEARLIGRATNLEMIGLLGAVLGGLAAAHMLDYDIPGIALGIVVFVASELIVRNINWRMTRPLAHLATGDNPRYDRVGRAARLQLDTIALIGAPLLLLAKLDIPTWLIAAGTVVAMFVSFALEFLLRRYLRRCNTRDAAAKNVVSEAT